jgi:hypothetical protein
LLGAGDEVETDRTTVCARAAGLDLRLLVPDTPPYPPAPIPIPLSPKPPEPLDELREARLCPVKSRAPPLENRSDRSDRAGPASRPSARPGGTNPSASSAPSNVTCEPPDAYAMKGLLTCDVVSIAAWLWVDARAGA